MFLFTNNKKTCIIVTYGGASMEEQLLDMITKTFAKSSQELIRISCISNDLKDIMTIFRTVEKNPDLLRYSSIFEQAKLIQEGKYDKSLIPTAKEIVAGKRKGIFSLKKHGNTAEIDLEKIFKGLQNELQAIENDKTFHECLVKTSANLLKRKEEGILLSARENMPFYSAFLLDESQTEYIPLFQSLFQIWSQEAIEQICETEEKIQIQKKKEGIPILMEPSSIKQPAYIAPSLHTVPLEIPMDYVRTITKKGDFELLEAITRDNFVAILGALLYQIEMEMLMLREEQRTIKQESIDFSLLQELLEELKKEKKTIRDHLPNTKEAVKWKK